MAADGVGRGWGLTISKRVLPEAWNSESLLPNITPLKVQL